MADPQIESEEVLDLLTGLVQKSLVAYEEDEQGQGRYRLLETVRQYARDRLREAGEAEAVRERHRDWFLALAEEAEPELLGPHQRKWLDRLEAEHDNLRAVLDRTAEREEVELGLRLAAAIAHFWAMRDYVSEGRDWLTRALLLPGAERRTVARAKALHAAGLLTERQGDSEGARVLFEQSLETSRELGDERGTGFCLVNLGSIAHRRGDHVAGQALLEEARATFAGWKRGGASPCHSAIREAQNAIVVSTRPPDRSVRKLYSCCESRENRGGSLSPSSSLEISPIARANCGRHVPCTKNAWRFCERLVTAPLSAGPCTTSVRWRWSSTTSKQPAAPSSSASSFRKSERIAREWPNACGR